jgi:hypothetical protein|tara:strand:- start:5 stop:460 length:456 start_codon:yes stop_codon:yes gene_type:complete
MSTIVGTNIEVTNIKYDSDTTSMIISSAGQITAQGENTNTTNLQQGLAKVWIKIDGTQSAGSMPQDSFNVTNMTDTNTGRHIINYTNNMNAVHYSFTGMARQDGSDDRAIIISQEEDDGTDTSNLPITTQNDGGSYVDTAGACVTIHGDLA